MAKILLFPIYAIASLAILANALSVAFQNENPDISVWLNPLNVQARINLASKNLRGKNKPASSNVKNIIETGRKYAPLNAALISLDGIYHKNIGEIEKAQEHFSTSLAILPTEYHGLIHKFEYQFNNRQYVKALDILNIMSKRWPDRQNTFQHFIPAIVITQKGFEHASKLFDNSKQLRFLLISALVKNPATANLAVKLVENWNVGKDDNYWRLGNFITFKLIKRGQLNEANIAFRSFLKKNNQDDYEYIYNDKFEKQILSNPFDWSIRKQIGVGHNIKKKRIDGELETYLEIKFLGKPIQYRNITQLVRLPAGAYKLRTHYFTKDLITPKPIKLSINCYNSNSQLATYIFDSKNSKSRTGEIKFNVPSKNCDLAQLYFHTDFLAKSWRNKYSGILGIEKISIEKIVH